MSAPYGSWMGSRQEEAFYAPHDLVVEVQSFLADHEALFAHESCAEVGVVFSTESNFELIARASAFADNLRNETVVGLEIAFAEVTYRLSQAAQPYDVLFFPDGKLRADHIAAEQLRRYRVLILPQCSYLTLGQAQALTEYLAAGGRIVGIGPVGANLDEQTRRTILDHPSTRMVRTIEAALSDQVLGQPQVTIGAQADLGLQIQQVANAAALHIVNYAYDAEGDAIIAPEGVEVTVRLPRRCTSATLYQPGSEPRTLEIQGEGNRHTLWFDRLPVYTIVLLSDELEGKP
jgi:hypothetical protein